MNRRESISVPFVHRLCFTRDVFGKGSSVLAEVMAPADGEPPARGIIFADDGLLAAQPSLTGAIQQWTQACAPSLQISHAVFPVPGGEACKNDRAVLDSILETIHNARLCRQSYIIALGGGAVLDVVGFAAAMAHRGIRLVRLPSTTLSQADSGVGVKNGVNAFGKKNYLGTFAVPWAVINDTNFLETQTNREWMAGFSEVIKVALVKDRALFDQVEAQADAIIKREQSISQTIIERSAALHLEHITRGGDPFELTAARPLDFGHWLAHKLEQMTNYTVSHGEAVAIGLAVDAIYSHLSGHFDEASLDRVLALLRRLGLPISHEKLQDSDLLMAGLDEFREHLGGRLTIAMLEVIGRSVDVYEIDESKMKEAIGRSLRAAEVS